MGVKKRLLVKVIPITRMECPTCIPLLEREVKNVEGVTEAKGSYMTKNLRVIYDPDLVQLPEIEAAIERIGYRIAYKKYPGIISKIKGLIRREKRGRVEAISDSDFPQKVLEAPKPVAVLFTTPTCPTCRVFKPVYEETADNLEGKAQLYMMDIASTDTWRRYSILTIPTVIIFQDGEVKEKLTSVPGREEIEEALDRKVSLIDKT